MDKPIELIANERKRQIEVKGFNIKNDDDYGMDQLAGAAACYALPDRLRKKEFGIVKYWPWDKKWWKPTPENRIRELVKAGALIVAEIERLQRIDK